MKSKIKITDSGSGVTTIDIEGTIGVPEEWQFEEPAGRVATYEKFQRTLTAIGRIRGGEVVVNIRSSGGDVGDALLIHDALSGLDAVITTRCHGYVASAATIIAQAASEGRREISANSLYLVHNSVAGCEGNADDFRQSEELLTKTDRRIAAIYAVRAGRESSEFLTLMAENNGSGRWLSPKEAVAEGLADRIIEAGGDVGPEEGAASGAEGKDAGAAGKGSGSDAGSGDSRSLRKLFGRRGKLRELPLDNSAADVVRAQQDVELEKLRRRIATLEGENARLMAKPTEIKIKEDPSPTSESRRSANYTAYEKDVEGFIN